MLIVATHSFTGESGLSSTLAVKGHKAYKGKKAHSLTLCMEYRESHQILSMLVLRLGGLRHQCEPSLKLSHTIKPWVFETIWSLSSLSYKFPSPPPYKPILKEPDRLRPTRDYQPVFWYEDQSGSYMDKILCLPPSLAPWLHNKGMPVRKKELTVNPVM